jgi:dihydrofolate reductase
MIAIAAMSRNRVIGADGRIPWHISEDLKFFKRTTLGHIIVMGRKTYDSLGKPLPGRENWVISREADIAGVTVLRSFDAIEEPTDGRQLYIIGGAQLYAALLPRCTELLLTRIDRDVAGDTFFPEFESTFDTGEILESGPDYEIRRHLRKESLERWEKK